MTAVGTLVEIPGQLVPHQDRTARLGAPAEGRVLQVHVQAGDRVRAGALLVTLQSQAASTARAEYDKAVAALTSQRAQAAFARTAKERAERLLAAKAIGRQEVERAQADDELARASLAQAESEVARAKAAQTHLSVSTDGGSIVLRSPLSGIVLSREAEPGAVVQPGSPLVAVTDPTTLTLELDLPDQAASVLSPGAQVRFVVPAFPADTFAGRVETVGGALDPATRTLPVRAHVPNRSGRLRPQTFAKAWIEGKERRPAALVPDSAVQQLDERPVVFVAVPDAKGGARFERRNVEVGATVGGQTQILGGIHSGDIVVVGGAFAVKSEFARSTLPNEGEP
ncbi:MAG: efflux RND transporter periplasmic adaptor subunit [Gemmatimonadales bacterium]